MRMMNGVSTFCVSEDSDVEFGAKVSDDVELRHSLLCNEASSWKCTFQFHTGTGAAAGEVEAWSLSFSGRPLAERGSGKACR